MVVKQLTCNGKLEESCLERISPKCKNKSLNINVFEDREIEYWQWKKNSRRGDKEKN